MGLDWLKAIISIVPIEICQVHGIFALIGFTYFENFMPFNLEIYTYGNMEMNKCLFETYS